MDRNSGHNSHGGIPAAAFFAVFVLLALLLPPAILVQSGCGGQASNDQTAAAGVPPLAAALKPEIRDPDFFGINTGTADILTQNVSLRPEAAGLTSFTFEARVRVDRIATAAAGAGISFLGDGRDKGYVLVISPGKERWRLTDTASRTAVAGGIEPGSFAIGSWHDLKAQVTEDRVHIFIDGVKKTPPEGIARHAGNGEAGLWIRSAAASFEDATLTDDSTGKVVFHDDFSGSGDDRGYVGSWQTLNPQAWSLDHEDDNGIYLGSVMLAPQQLSSAELSPAMSAHFDMMQAAGVKYVRVFFPWDDIQSRGPGSFSWDYYDAIVYAARQHGLKVVAGLVYAPAWAVAPEHRFEQDSYAYPPVDNADYTRFVEAAVKRYMPGGGLAQEQGWDDGYGVTDFEMGHEYNVGRIFQSEGNLFFAGWLGTLDQYVDLLKAGHDQVKAVCGYCTVLNGATGDDVPPAYPTPRTDPGVQRQTVWQGVEDLYENIRLRNPGDPDPFSKYFDVLNIHTYQWRMLTAQGQLPDIYGSYSFPDAKWYSDRLSRVVDVLRRYGDSGRDIWLTETSYASADSGDPFAGNLTEDGQAEALRIAFGQAAAFPQVKKVFWWYAFDVKYRVGLIRDDLSPKPAFDAYARLTGAR
ncbi:MAG: hypothetical protein ACYC5F_09925 [Thermoleophilia bacterium]